MRKRSVDDVWSPLGARHARQLIDDHSLTVRESPPVPPHDERPLRCKVGRGVSRAMSCRMRPTGKRRMRSLAAQLSSRGCGSREWRVGSGADPRLRSVRSRCTSPYIPPTSPPPLRTLRSPEEPHPAPSGPRQPPQHHTYRDRAASPATCNRLHRELAEGQILIVACCWRPGRLPRLALAFPTPLHWGASG